MSDKDKNPNKPQLPQGPRIEPDADPANRYWLLRAPLFRYPRRPRLSGDKQPKREE